LKEHGKQITPLCFSWRVDRSSDRIKLLGLSDM
jgi:hypothetical protein